MALGNKYGLHRVIEPVGSLPQPALRLDNSAEIWDNEILIDVDILNITAAAFTKLEEATDGDPVKIGRAVEAIVRERGKFQCPVTGAGGMLIGRVTRVGPALAEKAGLREGDKVATLVSLSLTPLRIDEVLRVDVERDQVFIRGHAVLFESGIYARLPHDMPESLAVAVLDVAGAPGYVAKMTRAGDTVVVIGAGKAGILCLHEAYKRAKPTGRVIAVEFSEKQCEVVRGFGVCDAVVHADATKPTELLDVVEKAAGGLADIAVNTVNVPSTELGTILCTKDHGTVVFFSMSTSFSKAALGAEGVGKVVTMLVGSGYTEGHVDIALGVLKENQKVRDYFEDVYCRQAR